MNGLIFATFWTLFLKRDTLKTPLGVIWRITGYMNFLGDPFPLKMKNQNHFICERSLLIAKRCCLVILWGLINLAKTIWGVLVFYPKSNCSCWLLSWGQISWGKIIREALSWCSYMRCNYPGGNIPGDNYSGGKFRGSNCPVTQRNRQLWVKIKHKII